MIEVNCPVCGNPVLIDIATAIDEEGEVFMCKNCGNTFRYTEK